MTEEKCHKCGCAYTLKPASRCFWCGTKKEVGKEMSFLYENTTTNNVLITVGDSLMAGNNSGVPFKDYLTLPSFQGKGWDKIDCSCAGASASKLARDPDSMNDVISRVMPNLSPYAPVNLALVWAGSNDWAQGRTMQQCYDAIDDLCSLLKDLGCIVVVMSMIDRDGTTSEGTGSYAKNAICTWLRANFTTFAHGFWDCGYISPFGQDIWDCGYISPFGQDIGGAYPTGTGCNNGTYYDTDKTHLKTEGFQLMASGSQGYDVNSILASVINGLLAPKYPLFNRRDAFDFICV